MSSTYDEEFIRQACQKSYGAFLRYMKPEYIFAEHNQLLISKLEAVVNGKIKRLMINMPPRHSKSETVSRGLPPWFLGKFPNKEVIFSTYAEEFAKEFGREVRNMVMTEQYQTVFPEVKIAKDSNTNKKFKIETFEGSYFAVGVKGPCTGRGAHLAIIDDPHKNRDEANSQTIRDAIYNWYTSTLYTRLTPDGAIIFVCTRWHEDDLAARILAEDDGEWEVVSMPAINEDTGKALWPGRFSQKNLMKIKSNIGMYDWEALYMQRPFNPEGNIIKLEWLMYYDNPPEDFEAYYWSIDTATKVKSHNDYSVLQYWGVRKNGYYLLKNIRQKMKYPKLKSMIKSMQQEFPAAAILIEDTSAGTSVIQDLKEGTTLPVIAKKIGRDLERDMFTRVDLASNDFQANNVYLPKNAEWLDTYTLELTAFPSTRHDDQLDATCIFLSHMQKMRRSNKSDSIVKPISTKCAISYVK